MPWDPAAHHNSAFRQHTVSNYTLAPFGKAGFLLFFFLFGCLCFLLLPTVALSTLLAEGYR